MAHFKEGTVFILDVGSNMKEVVQGKLTAFDVSRQCIKRMLQNKLFTDSKDEFALVLFGTEESDNRLNELKEDRYTGITTAAELKLVDWEILEQVEKLDVSESQADVFDALKVGLDVHEQDAKASKRKRFGKRRIILFSNLKGPMNATAAQMKTFASDMASEGVNMLQLLGCDFDEAEEEHPAEKPHKKGGKKTTESALQLVKQLFELIGEIDAVDCEAYSYEDAMKYATAATTRQVRPTPWKGVLEIGSILKIPVVAYSKVKAATPKQNWKQYYAGDTSVPVVRSTEFHVQRGLQREEVQKAETVSAYKYGTSLVPFSEEDIKSMKFPGVGKGLRVLGFAPEDQVKAHLYSGEDVKIMTAPPDDENARTAMSALVHALIEEKLIIVARFGYNAISAPRLVSLSPRIKKGKYEGLYFHYLPFENDLRLLTFAPLIGNPVKPEYTPSEKQLEAVGLLIDKMTLTENDPEYEKVGPKAIYNPHLQRLYSSLTVRAADAKAVLPEVDEGMLGQLVPPARLVKKSAKAAEKVKELFPLKKIEKKKFKKPGMFEDEDEQGAGDVEMPDKTDAADTTVSVPNITDFKKTPATTIGTVDPAKDLKEMVSRGDKKHSKQALEKGIEMANKIIFQTFEGYVYADKVLALISAMRDECIKQSTPEIVNDFLQQFKEQLVEKNQHTVWNKMVDAHITLISKKESSSSNVTEEQSKKFLHVEKVAVVDMKKAPVVQQDDDELDEMFK